MFYYKYSSFVVAVTRGIRNRYRHHGSATFTRFDRQASAAHYFKLGFTINGAMQLGIEASKGSITAGKDADFLIFDNDLLSAEQEGFSNNKPKDVYFGGKKVN